MTGSFALVLAHYGVVPSPSVTVPVSVPKAGMVTLIGSAVPGASMTPTKSVSELVTDGCRTRRVNGP